MVDDLSLKLNGPPGLPFAAAAAVLAVKKAENVFPWLE